MGLAQIVFAEAVAIDDEDSILLEVLDIHLERRGIHGYQNVHGVARRINIARGELHLESAYPGQRARRSTDFRREVRKGCQIVAIKSGCTGGMAAGDLHDGARDTAEAEDRALHDL